MQQQTIKHSFYDLLTRLEMQGHQQRIKNIQEHKQYFALLEKDLEALSIKEGIIIKPLPNKTYYDNGKVEVTVQACDSDFMKKICIALIRQGYADTDDSKGEERVLSKENIFFIVTTTPQKKTCASACSHHCKCNH